MFKNDCFQEENHGAENDDADDMPEVQETVSVIPGSTLLWRIDSRPPQSAMVQPHTRNNCKPREQELLHTCPMF